MLPCHGSEEGSIPSWTANNKGVHVPRLWRCRFAINVRWVRFPSSPHKNISWDRAVVARKAHNLEVGGSNPSPATNIAGWTGAVPAQSHKLNDEGSFPSPANNSVWVRSDESQRRGLGRQNASDSTQKQKISSVG